MRLSLATTCNHMYLRISTLTLPCGHIRMRLYPWRVVLNHRRGLMDSLTASLYSTVLALATLQEAKVTIKDSVRLRSSVSE